MTELREKVSREIALEIDRQASEYAGQFYTNTIADRILAIPEIKHIAALETASRALVAKLEECGPYLPHGSVRNELDALIAVLKSSEEG